MKIDILKISSDVLEYHIAGIERPVDIDADPWGVNWYPDIDAWCEQTFGQQDLWGKNRYRAGNECNIGISLLMKVS